MDNNIKKEAEQMVKSAESFLSTLQKAMDSIKDDIMSNPEHAKEYAKQMNDAKLQEKIKEFKETLNSL